VTGPPSQKVTVLLVILFVFNPKLSLDSTRITSSLAGLATERIYQDRPENPKALKPGDEWPPGAEAVAKRRRLFSSFLRERSELK